MRYIFKSVLFLLLIINIPLTGLCEEISIDNYVVKHPHWGSFLKDTEGRMCAVYIWADSNIQHRRWGEYNLTSANFKVGILIPDGVKTKDLTVTPQDVQLFPKGSFGELPLDPYDIHVTKRVFIVTSESPSLLVVTQFASTSNDFAKLFFIAKGELKQIKFMLQNGQMVDYIVMKNIRKISQNQFLTSDYSNSHSAWFNRVWEFDKDMSKMILLNTYQTKH